MPLKACILNTDIKSLIYLDIPDNINKIKLPQRSGANCVDGRDGGHGHPHRQQPSHQQWWSSSSSLSSSPSSSSSSSSLSSSSTKSSLSLSFIIKIIVKLILTSSPATSELSTMVMMMIIWTQHEYYRQLVNIQSIDEFIFITSGPNRWVYLYQLSLSLSHQVLTTSRLSQATKRYVFYFKVFDKNILRPI